MTTEIGRKIRLLRQSKLLTQEELADRTELSKSFISQVERDLTSPSIATLVDILQALGTDLREFFGDASDSQVVFRDADYFEKVNEELGNKTEWIIPNAQKNQMEPIILYLRPGAQSKRVDPHEGEEFGYVLSGRLLLFRDGDKKGIRVRRGENFCMKGDKAHWLMNDGERDAAVLWISTPPVF